MIEKTVYDHMKAALDVPVYMEIPNMDGQYITIEKTGGGLRNHLYDATFAVQSWSNSLFEAAELNEKAKAAMLDLITEDDVISVSLNSDYNFTDTTTKRYRYQAVFDVKHY